MDLSFLSFLAEPWFVLPWYLIGAAGAAWVVADEAKRNTPLKRAMKWAWPIIVFFFSVLGLALYLLTARAPEIGEKDGEQKARAHRAYEKSTWRRVNGAVIHCVAGDGLGIMSAMVIARATGMSFWQEFWFEYAVGFAFGLFIFQLASMRMMTDSIPKALGMAFRAEFFSMLTVMGGMGAVMTFVTPMVVGAQPKPLTFAFWGFGMLGLVVGYLFTWPMNWMLVKIGWKHGMGKAEDAHPAPKEKRPALLGAMAALGVAALIVPAWLTEEREAMSCPGELDPEHANVGDVAPETEAIVSGVQASIDRARAGLRSGRRGAATTALDDLRRAGEVGRNAVPAAGFVAAMDEIQHARRALQQGDDSGAIRRLDAAGHALHVGGVVSSPPANLERYAGATVIDARGAVIGEVKSVSDGSLDLAIGGLRDVWGLVDIGEKRSLTVPSSGVALGTPRSLGPTYVMVPTSAVCAARTEISDRRAARSGRR